MILMGSRAIKYHCPEFRDVDGSDYDLIGSSSEFAMLLGSLPIEQIIVKKEKKLIKLKTGEVIEWENEEATESNRRLMQTKDYMQSTRLLGQQMYIPSLFTLYLTKRATKHLPIHWWKNVKDLNWLKEHKFPEDLLGAGDNDIIYLNTRADEAKQRTPSLKQSNMSFFGQSDGKVTQQYPHDAVHFAVAYSQLPMWTKLKPEGSTSAWCEKDLWAKLTHKEKIQCIREEAYVIAWERKVSLDNSEPLAAYQWAIMRIGTNLCSGYFRDFCCDNAVELEYPDIDYIARIKWNIDKVLDKGDWKVYMYG